MFLRKLLTSDVPIEDIEVRLIDGSEDLLLGTASWTGEKLISKDFKFSVHDKVWKYQFNNGKLIYWINAAFIGCDDFDD